MKHKTLLHLLGFVLLIWAVSCVPSNGTIVPALQQQNFIENKGQWPDFVRYKAQYPGASVWITESAVYFDFVGSTITSGTKVKVPSKFRSMKEELIDEVLLQKHCVRMDFTNATLTSFNKQQQCVSTYNYVIGNNIKQWITNVASYKSVEIETDKGYSVLFTTDNGKPRFDFIVKPNTDVRNIAVRYTGATSLEVLNKEVLAIKTTCGTIHQGSLKAYQQNGMLETTPVQCNIKLHDNTVEFSVGAYNKNQELIIDPTVFATYLGTDGYEEINAVKQMPNNGDVIVVGFTTASTFPKTTGTYTSPVSGNEDVFVAKFDNTFNTLLFATYFGGSGTDKAYDVCLSTDDNKNIIVVGETSSTNFPTTTGFLSQNNLGKTDAFIAKLNNAGTTLLYGTYFGGAEDDRAYGVITDDQNSIYFCGETFSSNMMIKVGSFKTTYSGQGDGFVACVASTNQLAYSTFYGGTGRDRCLDIASSVTAENEAFVTGETKSADLPLAPADWWGNPNCAQTKINGTGATATTDAFIARFNGLGSKLVLGTYFGGNGDETGYTIYVDNGSKPIIGGTTSSSNLNLIRNLPQGKKNGKDGFLCGTDLEGKLFNYTTYFGGDGDDAILDLKFDGTNLIVAGKTTSNNFPVTNDAGQAENKLGGDGFIASIGYSTVFYSSYLGGTGNDELRSVVATNGMVSYVAGVTTSNGLPTPGLPYQQNMNGISDGYVGKYTYSSFKVNTPVATDKPCTGTPINILWDVSNFASTDSYTIEVSPDNGATWQVVKNNVVAKNYNWIIPNTQTGSTNYRVRVTHNATGFAILNPAPFTIRKAATVTSQSSDTTLCQNTMMRLVVSVDGSDVKYQWTKNNSNIDGATNAIYSVSQVDNSTAGTYAVKITAGCTTGLASGNMVVTVNPAPQFITNLKDVTAFEGTKAEFTVQTNATAIDYKWQVKKGAAWVNITNAPNSTTYTINTTQKFDEGKYRVIIANNCGIDTSDESTLSVTTSSVPDYSSNADWIVYPNPTQSQIQVCNKTNMTENIKNLEVCNIQGVVIPSTQSTISPDCISITPLEATTGLYFVRFQMGTSWYRYPVVLVK